ncbi:LOW QUALITY PROTEIN: proline-rich protein HaeIII subfamily 1 [Drosophila tropicalis]|uniref:LOW QUALITY PROTEIN: proline-rich protein HaeIII subfamily 1 n=1 Tax=Drosophila tropicalis TaxID=46794 RepID=UPI0035AC1EF0
MEFDWKQLLPAVWAIVLFVPLAQADVSHLSLSHEHGGHGEETKQADAAVEMNDGQFYPVAGLPLPPGYAIPTGNNVPPPPVAPPNFPLPIYPPYFGFGGSQGAGPGPGPGFSNVGGQQFAGGPIPEPTNGQYTAFPTASQGLPFPGAGPQGGVPFQPGSQFGSFANGPQAGPFPNGQQAGPFPPGPFPSGPQPGAFPSVPQAGPFPPSPQGVPFPAIPQGGPFPSQPQFPPDYLTNQGLPLAGAQQPFLQPSGFNVPPGFAGPGIDFSNPYQQPFADEAQPEEVDAHPTTDEPSKAKQSSDTVYAPNGGYVYQRAK